jgi:hypothetical protein
MQIGEGESYLNIRYKAIGRNKIISSLKFVPFFRFRSGIILSQLSQESQKFEGRTGDGDDRVKSTPIYPNFSVQRQKDIMRKSR